MEPTNLTNGPSGLTEPLSQRQVKAALKEALKEWLDDKFTTFGKFAAISIAAAGLATIIYFILISQGWKAP